MQYKVTTVQRHNNTLLHPKCHVNIVQTGYLQHTHTHTHTQRCLMLNNTDHMFSAGTIIGDDVSTLRLR